MFSCRSEVFMTDLLLKPFQCAMLVIGAFRVETAVTSRHLETAVRETADIAVRSLAQKSNPSLVFAAKCSLSVQVIVGWACQHWSGPGWPSQPPESVTGRAAARVGRSGAYGRMMREAVHHESLM